ncbi:MAG: transcriptional repressor LexA [Rhodospirillaceae bacterium]|nr:transcriptional repressor LexA [Rhodospirillaceae bacterium]
MLTKKQYELLTLLNDRIKETGVPPSFDEMKDALGLKSKSGIHRLISGLEERGFIRRLPHRARALEILKLPENISDDNAPSVSSQKISGNVIRGDFRHERVPEQQTGDSADNVELPMLGRIAAGTPIAAISDPSSYIGIPASMIGGGEHFALEIDGDSMIEAGIFDGDTVIIQRTNRVENGTICVALVDGEEATLKRLRKKNNSIALEPANKDFETRIFGPDQVQVQGRLVGLIRKY